jgi:hypothetical protein
MRNFTTQCCPVAYLSAPLSSLITIKTIKITSPSKASDAACTVPGYIISLHVQQHKKLSLEIYCMLFLLNTGEHYKIPV